MYHLLNQYIKKTRAYQAEYAFSPLIYSGKSKLHPVRFGEALRLTQDKLNSKNFYAFNPSFDRCSDCND